MRLDLWNAEVRGHIKTDKGEIEFRTFTHTDQMVNVFETIAKGGEKATWSWSPGLASDPRKVHKKEPLTEKDTNAPPVSGADGDIAFSFQPLKPGGGHTTAWKTVDSGNGRSVVYAAVGFANQETASKSEAVNAVKKAAETGVPALVASHRAWWNRFWPEGFVSVPDTRIESFLLHPDVQDGLRHAPWQTGPRSDGAMVPQHAMGENLVEPQHPARVLAAVDRQPPRTREIPLRTDRQWCRRPRQERRSIPVGLRRRRPHLRLQLLKPGGRRTLQPAMDDAQLLAAIPVFDGRCVAAPAVPDAETHDQLLPSSPEGRSRWQTPHHPRPQPRV